MTPPRDRRLCHQALDSIDDCIWQTVAAIANTDDPAAAADLSSQLNDLDTGKLLLSDLLATCATGAPI